MMSKRHRTHRGPLVPLELCANGCGVPPCPPSLVICCECQRKITRSLDAMMADSLTRVREKGGSHA